MRSWKGILATLLRSVRNGTPLPKGHGRLIDADELKNDAQTMTEWSGDVFRCVTERTIDYAPTIIEADKEEDEKINDASIKALEQEPFINKPCVSEKVCEHDKKVIFDKIRAKIDNAIEFERKWLYDAGHISKDIDIALNAIKSVMTESETENGNDN